MRNAYMYTYCALLTNMLFWMKDGNMKMKPRKLLTHVYELDYDDAGPNPKHTRKPGKGN